MRVFQNNANLDHKILETRRACQFGKGPSTVDQLLDRFYLRMTDSEGECSDKSTDKALPHHPGGERLIHFLHINAINQVISIKPTSIENKTPPIGEPKATATPAALEAVTISLIFTIVSPIKLR